MLAFNMSTSPHPSPTRPAAAASAKASREEESFCGKEKKKTFLLFLPLVEDAVCPWLSEHPGFFFSPSSSSLPLLLLVLLLLPLHLRPAPHPSRWPVEAGTHPFPSRLHFTWPELQRHKSSSHAARHRSHVLIGASVINFSLQQKAPTSLAEKKKIQNVITHKPDFFKFTFCQIHISDVSQRHFLLYASLIFISCLVSSSPVISCVLLPPAPAACLCASGLSSVPLCCGGCVKTASRGQDLGVLSATLWLRVKGPARWGLGKRDSK